MTPPPQVSDRFPDLDSLVTAKLLLPHEAARLQVVLQKVASELHPKVRNHGEGPY